MNLLLAKDDYVGLKKLIEANKIKCSVSGTSNWTDIRQFNLMFSTQIGSVAEESDTIYLRPETAQGIFVNFLNGNGNNLNYQPGNSLKQPGHFPKAF